VYTLWTTRQWLWTTSERDARRKEEEEEEEEVKYEALAKRMRADLAEAE
jgi:hypothetical protein